MGILRISCCHSLITYTLHVCRICLQSVRGQYVSLTNDTKECGLRPSSKILYSILNSFMKLVCSILTTAFEVATRASRNTCLPLPMSLHVAGQPTNLYHLYRSTILQMNVTKALKSSIYCYISFSRTNIRQICNFVR